MFFLMTLALRLGRTLSELTKIMTAGELKMWMAYDRRSPVGDIRGDIQTAQLVTAMFNSQGGKTSLPDMVMRWGEQEEADSAGIEGFFEKLAE